MSLVFATSWREWVQLDPVKTFPAYNCVLICTNDAFFINKCAKLGLPFHRSLFIAKILRTHEFWWPVLSELYYKEKKKKGSFNKNQCMWVNVCMCFSCSWNAASANTFLVMRPVQKNIGIKVFPFSPLELWVAQMQHPRDRVQRSFVLGVHLSFHFHFRSTVKFTIAFVEEACILLKVSEIQISCTLVMWWTFNMIKADKSCIPMFSFRMITDLQPKWVWTAW